MPRLPEALPSHLRPIGPVGRGGSAVVWRARDRRAGRDVAIRVVGLDGASPLHSGSVASGRADPVLVDRFEHEVRALTRLAACPHVIEVLAAGVDDGVGWVVTPLAEASLWELLTGGGPLAASRVVSLAVALASALDAAHGLEVVHGDVTPANVVLVDGRPVLADFGLATWVQPGSGRRDERRGATPGWAAPERFDGAAPTSASDVYGLGATLWSAATARRPLPHGPLERAVVPRGIDSIVAACCDEEPRRRPSASEVVGLAESERDRRRRYCPDP